MKKQQLEKNDNTNDIADPFTPTDGPPESSQQKLAIAQVKILELISQLEERDHTISQNNSDINYLK